ncbi:MAG: RecT family recombinase [Gammaproteobacteria bacterium]|nr:RecT family recombinase [Gammaproteobacteria bacterium]
MQGEIQEYQGDVSSTTALALNPDNIASMMKLAQTMVTSKVTVPDHLKTPGDCLAIIMQAMQWGMNPFAVAQKTHIVNGKLGYEAQLVNAVVTSSGAITGRFHYEYKGAKEALECRVGAVLRGEKEITWGEWLCVASVATKNSPLWKTNQKQQMAYLQLKNWTRLYAPAAIMGVYTVDELQDSNIGGDPLPPLQEGRQEIEMYSDEQFQKNLPKWKEKIDAGKASPDYIISMVSSKAMLSEEQKKAIRDLAPAPTETVNTETGEVAQS